MFACARTELSQAAGQRKLHCFARLHSSIWIMLSLGLEESDTGTKPSAPSGTLLDWLERIAIGASPRSASWTQRRNKLAFVK